MKKIFLALLLAVVSLGASAQFEQGTKYAGASLSGFGLSYSKSEDFRLGLHAQGGYFVADGWMALAQMDWEHMNGTNNVSVGAGARYYLVQNGLFGGLALKYQHVSPNINNVLLCPEAGYCFYLNQHVSIEPSVYVDMSMNHFKDFTKVGLKIGFGYYF